MTFSGLSPVIPVYLLLFSSMFKLNTSQEKKSTLFREGKQRAIKSQSQFLTNLGK